MKNMIKKITEKLKNERGVLVVESAIVFPVMFFVLLFIIFIGNMYYEQARVESIVMAYATKGAQCVADPFLYDMEATNAVPRESEKLKLEPYRYILGSFTEGTITDVEKKIEKDVKKEIGDKNLIFFSNSNANVTNAKAEFVNYILYSTFVVEAEYKIQFPIRFLGEKNATIMKFSARAESPVNDTDEFIRNVDMAIDLVEGTQLGDTIKGMFDKMNSFILTISGKKEEG